MIRFAAFGAHKKADQAFENTEAVEVELRTAYEKALRTATAASSAAQRIFEEVLSHPVFAQREGAKKSLSRSLQTVRHLTLKNLAVLKEKGGDKADALDLFFRAASTADSPDASLWTRVGLLAFELANLSLARSALESALKLDARNWTAMDALLSVLLSIGDAEACTTLANHCIQGDSRHPKARLILAQLSGLQQKAEPQRGVKRPRDELKIASTSDLTVLQTESRMLRDSQKRAKIQRTEQVCTALSDKPVLAYTWICGEIGADSDIIDLTDATPRTDLSWTGLASLLLALHEHVLACQEEQSAGNAARNLPSLTSRVVITVQQRQPVVRQQPGPLAKALSAAPPEMDLSPDTPQPSATTNQQLQQSPTDMQTETRSVSSSESGLPFNVTMKLDASHGMTLTLPAAAAAQHQAAVDSSGDAKSGKQEKKADGHASASKSWAELVAPRRALAVKFLQAGPRLVYDS